MQFGNFHPHLYPQFRIQIRQRFIKQEYLRIAHDGASDGNTLTLTTGELLRQTIQQMIQFQDTGRLAHTLFNFGFAFLRQPQSEAHVLPHRHVRVKRVGLEHHGDTTIRRRDIIDLLAIDHHLAVRNGFQSGDHAQQRGFTATGRTHEHHKFAMLDIQIDAMNGLYFTKTFDHFIQF